MMLWTRALEPPSWLAMLPQKFSIATTRMPAEPPAVADEPLPQPESSTASNGISSNRRRCIFGSDSFGAGRQTDFQVRASRTYHSLGLSLVLGRVGLIPILSDGL